MQIHPAWLQYGRHFQCRSASRVVTSPPCLGLQHCQPQTIVIAMIAHACGKVSAQVGTTTLEPATTSSCFDGTMTSPSHATLPHPSHHRWPPAASAGFALRRFQIPPTDGVMEGTYTFTCIYTCTRHGVLSALLHLVHAHMHVNVFICMCVCCTASCRQCQPRTVHVHEWSCSHVHVQVGATGAILRHTVSCSG